MALIIPKQKISQKEKTKEWGISTINELDKYSASRGTLSDGRSKRFVKQVNYDLINGRFNRSDFDYVTRPYGYSENSFPAELNHFDIISPKIHLLLGEEMKRPFNFRVVSENNDSSTAIEEQRKNLIMQIFSDQEMMGKATDDEIQQELAKIEEYVKYSYKDMRAVFGQHALNYLVRDRQLVYLFNNGFRDALVAGEEIYWTGIVNGEPVCRVVNPIDISIVLDPNSEFIDEAQAIIEERWMTQAMIMDEFFDELTPEELDRLEQQTLTNSYYPSDNTPFHIVAIDETPIETTSNTSNRGVRDEDGNIRVVRYEWKSMRKVGFLTFTNEAGEEETVVVDETFKTDKNLDEKVEWKWINEYWEGIKILDDIYICIGPKVNQRRRMDNPNICRSGYVGVILNNRNSTSVSLVGRAKTYQYLYNIVYYRLELALAKSKGKAAIMDIAQIPTSEGWDVQKWMYYLDALGIMFVNSFEEGKRGTQFQGKTPSFNQFQSIDLTMGDMVQQCVGILDKIEDKVGELMGVTRQRLGQIQSSELVGNTERSVSQSSHVTEYLFNIHNEVKRRVLTSLLDYAKIAWRKGKKINYIDDTLAHVFYNIDGETFDNSEYGVFVSNTLRDTQILEGLRSLGQVALQSDKANLTDVIMMMKSDSITEIERRLEQGERKRSEKESQMQKSQQELEQAKLEQAQGLMAHEAEENQKDRDNKIQVATIQALGFSKDTDENNNGMPDVLEYAAHVLKEKEFMLKEKEMKSNEKIENSKVEAIKEQNKGQVELENKKIQLKREEMAKKVELEKLKIAAKKASDSKSKASKK